MTTDGLHPAYPPSFLTGDLEAQAEWSWKLFVGLGVLLLAWTIFRDLTRKKEVVEAKVAPEDEQEK